jgi:hypothetical protein
MCSLSVIVLWIGKGNCVQIAGRDLRMTVSISITVNGGTAAMKFY